MEAHQVSCGGGIGFRSQDPDVRRDGVRRLSRRFNGAPLADESDGKLSQGMGPRRDVPHTRVCVGVAWGKYSDVVVDSDSKFGGRRRVLFLLGWSSPV